MSYSVWGRWFLTSDLSGSPVLFQPVRINNDGIDDFVLRICKTQVVLFNDPNFTSLEMRIYSDLNGSPGQLLFTSTGTQLKADLQEVGGPIIETWFDFESEPDLDKDDTYHFALWINGYTGIESSHVAWVKAWPDPIYSTGIALDAKYLGVDPFKIALIGADL